MSITVLFPDCTDARCSTVVCANADGECPCSCHGRTVSDTVTVTLPDFLLARLDDDSAVALDALPHFPSEVAIVENVWEDACAHIARWDPARVLAEVAAKRRTVEFFQKLSDLEGVHLYVDASAARDAVETVILDMASVYADHPDFRDEWA